MKRGVALATIIVLAACSSGSSKDTAESALRRQIEYVSTGQGAKAWAELHPAQQALIPEDHYVQCLAKSDVPNVKVTVDDSYQEPTVIPGTDQKVPSTALVVTLKSVLGSQKTTFHEMNVDGVWKFSLTDPAEYADGECP